MQQKCLSIFSQNELFVLNLCFIIGTEHPSRSREVILQDLARILQDYFKNDASLQKVVFKRDASFLK